MVAREDGKANAFLPGTVATNFPTMRLAVCATPEVRLFLNSLGIVEPDPVDDVIRNLLPKYQQQEVDVDNETYAADIERIRAAFNTDSTAQKDKLRVVLRETPFVMVVDTGDGKKYIAKPGEAYIATDRLQQLFTNVPDVLIVDNDYDCLRGEEIRDLLVSCGASRYLIPEVALSILEHSQKEQIRREAGLERASWENLPEDFTLRGLTELLEYLPKLQPKDAANRAKVLWEALADLESRGSAAFYGSYKWGYFHEAKTARFEAAFVRTLNQVGWVPNANGELVTPGLVVFDTLGWKPNPFLQTKIIFKPPIIDQLAKEAGIDPAILDLLRRDPNIVAELTTRLSKNPTLEAEPSAAPGPDAGELADGDVYDGAKDLYGDDMPDIPPGTFDPDGGDGVDAGAGGSRKGFAKHKSDGRSGGKRSPGHTGGRPFISYVGTHPGDDDPDPDGLDQQARMQIEESAIDLIIALEPALLRTPSGNPGFDLFEMDTTSKIVRWIEVKAMTGSLNDRPAGLSNVQFEFAHEKGEAYWLYIVEYATDSSHANILKIQNPVGHARTFTFDKGWAQIATES